MIQYIRVRSLSHRQAVMPFTGRTAQSADASTVDGDPELTSVKLKSEEVAEEEREVAKFPAHPWRLPQSPRVHLQPPAWIGRHDLVVLLLADAGFDRFARLPVLLRDAPNRSVVYARARRQSVSWFTDHLKFPDIRVRW